MVVFIWHTCIVYSLVKPNFKCLTFHLHVCALLPPQNMDQSEHASQISSQRDLRGGSWLAESGGSGTKCERPPLLSLLLPPAEKGSSVWVCRLSQVSENHPAHTTVFKCPRLGVCFQSSCSVIELARRATDSGMLLTMSVKSCCLPILFPGKWRLLTRFLVAASYHIFVCVQKGRPVHAVAHFFLFFYFIEDETCSSFISVAEKPVCVTLIISQEDATHKWDASFWSWNFLSPVRRFQILRSDQTWRWPNITSTPAHNRINKEEAEFPCF